eukprot:TRINITY_DN16057_c0_g1_i1.p1 TRINITY_DN16057_c0_g1~~TRINITY_DN16057_c0_g1_i1.p1  ORF type:complete len:929 (-),score=214.19 TRINITY_DN16057_c0_g1_i1:127-2841(-)
MARVWYYQVSEQEYLPYPDEACRDLEDQYQRWENQQGPAQVEMRSGKYTYRIDFQMMHQENLATRKIRRLDRRQNVAVVEMQGQIASKSKEIANLRAQLSRFEGEGRHSREQLQATVDDLHARCQQQAAAIGELRAASLRKSQEVNELKAQATAKQREAENHAAERKRTSEQLQFQERRVVQLVEKNQIALASQLAAESQVTRLTRQLEEKNASLAEAEQLKNTCTSQWQFQNHLQIWQPYDPESNARLIRLYREWLQAGRPGEDYEISDRYVINFSDSKQTNLRSEKDRPIRLVQTSVAPESTNAQEEEKCITGLVSRLSTEITQLQQQIAAKQQQLETSERQVRNLTNKADLETQRLKDELRADQTERSQAEKEQATLKRQWQQQMVDAKLECEKLRKQTLASEAELKKVRDAEGIHEQRKEQELQAVRAQCDKMLADASRELAELREQQKAAEVELKKSREAETVRLQELRRSYETEMSSLQVRISDRKAELDDMSQKKADAEENQKEAGEVLAGLWRECQKMTADKEELGKHLDTQREEAARLSAEKESAEKSLKQLDCKEKDLTARSKYISQREKEVKGRENALQKAVVQSLSSQALRFIVDADLMKMPALDDKELRKVGTNRDLLCAYGQQMHASSAMAAKLFESSLGTELIDLLTNLPDAKNYAPLSQRDLDPMSADFKFIETVFQGSLRSHRLHYDSEEWCDPPKLEVVRISTVPFSAELLKKYMTDRERISKRDLPSVPAPMHECIRPVISTRNANEYFLFHGCPWSAAEKITTEGFDWKHRGENKGAMFGQGTYFAPYASKCDFYADPGKDGTKTMFFARVMLGASVPRWRKCTDVKTVGPEFDSICALAKEHQGSVDFPEMVIFSKYQALPCYKIEYKHGGSCACNLCRRSMP